jgi:hypothetical protein
MKRLLLLSIFLLSLISAKAQNPFAKYGYTPKIATLSKGQFNEFHDQDTVVQIGSVLYNTKSKQIVAFVETYTVYSEATLEADIVSRWISPDPLADHPTQVMYTPYHYAGDNPIRWTDPDGRCPWCVVWAVVEVGLAVYDAYETGATIIDPKASLGDKLLSAGGFALGAILPGGGYGKGAKETAKAVDNAIYASKVLDNANDAKKGLDKGADFVVTKDGTAIPTSQSKMREGFDNAGFPKKEATKTSEKGQIHTVPTKNGNVDVRTMEGGSGGDKRAVFNTPGTNSPRTPDGKTPTGTKEQIRKDSHLKQKD